ncbi:TPA: hypothetical protein N0F65_003035 [Lagenidium giganteum]|uniref:Peptidase C39-like domain-containing protein n=1 Tax=Lagenidium giganteum TaxID=4803 RepID=A0AAV2YWC9_9STRA|nr:TPA: hypothetical protein N0F65_003035 [Lagenidium giganteum]
MNRRQRVVCQNQDHLSERNAYCGLYGVNNALQQRDFITPAICPGEDHGDPRYGAYIMVAFQGALSKRGYDLILLNITGTFKKKSKDKWWEAITRSSRQSILIIGVPPKQEKGIYHCISRANVGDRYVFIDSDSYFYVKSEGDALNGFFEELAWIYSIEKMQ